MYYKYTSMITHSRLLKKNRMVELIKETIYLQFVSYWYNEYESVNIICTEEKITLVLYGFSHFTIFMYL